MTCKKFMYAKSFSTAIFLCFLATSAAANDSAAERTPAGLVFKTIRDISIEKEDLKISKNKIEVSYSFFNNSSEDIVTEIAFPIPNYEYVEDNVIGNPWFEDFTVTADGKKIDYQIIARALLDGKDFTDKLKNKGISIHDFNARNTEQPDGRLSPKAKHNAFRDAQCAGILRMIGKDSEEFITLGLIEQDGQPNWTVSKSYVWVQRFPKKSVVSIKHTYTPCYGYDQHYFDYKETLESFAKESCIDSDTALHIRRKFKTDDWLKRETVSYILQTANNWKTPIKEFKLQIFAKKDEYMGICFDKKINRISPEKYETTIINYVPSSDIKVHWVQKKTRL